MMVSPDSTARQVRSASISITPLRVHLIWLSAPMASIHKRARLYSAMRLALSDSST